MNKIKVVTGYIPLGVVNSTPEIFKRDGTAMLEALPCPYKFFEGWKIEDCWVDRFLTATDFPRLPSANGVPADRFPTPEIMLQSNIVQNQKNRWLVTASQEDAEADIFVWIDYGILKQKPMEPEDITNFIRRLEKADIKWVTAPGICTWRRRPDRGEFCDRFCGSVVVVPRADVFPYHMAMATRTMQDVTKHRSVEWEVNYMADLEMDGFPIRQYQCWWDRSQLENFPDA